ncbi:MAG: hypothetical protein KDA78_07125 [Planctomycetaceae bacterium]|nr:hypothetical protein [Planctomycetaceae bacterium]
MEGNRFCTGCGTPLVGVESTHFNAPPIVTEPAPDASAETGPSTRQEAREGDLISGPEEMAWSVDVPLISNPLIMGQLTLCLGGGIFALFLLLIGLAIYEQQWRQVVMAFKVTGIAAAFITGLSLFSILVLLRNRMRMQFAITSQGVGSFVASGAAKSAANASQVLGAIKGDPTVAAAGLLAEAKRTVLMDWREIEEIRLLPKSRTIVVRDSWRPVISIHTSADNWDAVAAAMERGVARSRKAREMWKLEQSESSTKVSRFKIFVSALLAITTVVASVLLFQFPEAVSPPTPWLWAAIICSVLPFVSTRLRRPAGAIVAMVLVIIAGLVLYEGLREHHTPRFTEVTGIDIEYDPARYTWTAFNTFEDREWGQTCLGCLGWALLAGLAVSALRQKTK